MPDPLRTYPPCASKTSGARAAAVGLFVSAVLALAGCGGAPTPKPGAPGANDVAGGRVRAVVSIQPQAYFVERVGGPRVAVEVLVGQGQSPHLYEPTPRQIAALSRAQVYFSIGMEFEQRLLDKLARGHRQLKVIDTRRGIALREPDADCLHSRHDDAGPRPADGHQHADGEDHAGHAHQVGGLADPHIWLSPRLVQVQARTIADALIELDPGHRAEYEANLTTFLRELEDLDAWIAQRLAAARGGEFLVFHPSYGYFADAYGLRQVPIEVSGKEPSARELARIVEHARARGARVVLFEPRYAPTAAEAVARAIGGSVVLVDPLGRDYFAMMRDLADKVTRALTASGGRLDSPNHAGSDL